MASLPWQKRPATGTTGSNYGILTSSTRKPEAWELLKFLLGPEAQKRLAVDLRLLPVRRDVSREAARLHTGFHVYAEGVPYAFPPLDWMPGTSQTVQPLWEEAIQSVLSGQVPVRTALEEVARRMRSALGQ